MSLDLLLLRSAGVLLPVLLLASCHSATDPDSAAEQIRVERVALRTEPEQRAWPFTPSVSGGAPVTIRGYVDATCSRIQAKAWRSSRDVQVKIFPEKGTVICPAIWSAWQPFSAVLPGLEPGTYRIRVTAAGHQGYSEFKVTVPDD